MTTDVGGTSVSLFVRQVRSLTRLVFLYWARAGLPSQLRGGAGRRTSGALLRIVALLGFANLGYRSGLVVGLAPAPERPLAVAWMLLGLAVLGGAWSMTQEAATLREANRGPLTAPILNGLPIAEASRVVVGLFERLPVYVVVLSAVLAAASSGRPSLVIFGVLFSAAAILFGGAAMRLLRTIASPLRIARFSFVIVATQLLGVFLVLGAPYLAKAPSLGPLVALLLPFGHALVDGRHPVSLVVAPAVAIVAGGLAIRLAERIGYDRIDIVPTTKLEAVDRADLTLEKVERVLTSREPGGRVGPWIMCAQTITFAGGLVLAVHYNPMIARLLSKDAAILAVILRTLGVITIFSGFLAAQPRSLRIVIRDVSARPMLSGLPIRPSDLLEGKTRSLYRSVLFAVMPFFLLLFLPSWPGLREAVAWRGVTIVIGALLAASASVSVSFLTQGLGSVRALGTRMTLESTLVATPLIAVAAAPYEWNAVIGLAILSLVTVEARRSALRCVRWLDDPDDFDRETPVWRALVVLAAFQAMQTLSARVVSVIPVDASSRASLGYAGSAVILLMLTMNGRRGLPPIPIIPKLVAYVPVGAILGAVSGIVGVLYVRFMLGHGIVVPSDLGDGSVRVASVSVVVVLAPIAEETFFRGWLQNAVHGDLPPRWRILAPVLTSFAFAAVHPPLSFLPIFFLGLVTGFLAVRTRAVGPAMIAHAVHNAIVVFGAGISAGTS